MGCHPKPIYFHSIIFQDGHIAPPTSIMCPIIISLLSILNHIKPYIYIYIYIHIKAMVKTPWLLHHQPAILSFLQLDFLSRFLGFPVTGLGQKIPLF